jgi:hypothetical protein
MDINKHIKQGILHYLIVAGKYPHVQALFPQKQFTDHDLLEILFYEAYSRLSKESRFFFTTISVFCLDNYTPVPPITLTAKTDDGVETTPVLPSDTTLPPAGDDSIEDLLNGAMPKKFEP